MQIARINDSASDVSERLFWITGKGITSSSVKVQMPLPDEAWAQLQLGIDADGRVELLGIRRHPRDTRRHRQERARWREQEPGLDRQPQPEPRRDLRSLDRRLRRRRDVSALAAPRLEPRARPTEVARAEPAAFEIQLRVRFLHELEPCARDRHRARRGGDANPDFVLHLGDFGYLDSAVYTQSKNGYLAKLERPPCQ